MAKHISVALCHTRCRTVQDCRVLVRTLVFQRVYGSQQDNIYFNIITLNADPAKREHRYVSGGSFLGAELLHGSRKAKPRFTTEHTEVTENGSPVCLRVLCAPLWCDSRQLYRERNPLQVIAGRKPADFENPEVCATRLPARAKGLALSLSVPRSHRS